MTDINSHVELPDPSRRPGATEPARGDTPVAAGEFEVKGITGLWFCWKRGSWDAELGCRGESAARSEQLPERGPGKDGDATLGAKKAGRKKEKNHLFPLETTFAPSPHGCQTRAGRNIKLLLLLFSFSFQNSAACSAVRPGERPPRGNPGSARVRQSQGITAARNSAGLKKGFDFYMENKNIQTYNRKY